MAPVSLLCSHFDVPAFIVCTSRLGPARAWSGINAGLTKLRRLRLALLNMSHCQWEVGSTKRIPGIKVSQKRDSHQARPGLAPSSCWSGFKLMNPDHMSIFKCYDPEGFSIAVLVSLSLLGGQPVAFDRE